MRYLQIVIFIFLPLILLTNSCSQEKVCPAELFSHNLAIEFSKLAETKYQVITDGTGGSIYEKIRKICMSFTYRGKMNVEEARETIVHLTTDFIKIIKENPESEKYIDPTIPLINLIEIIMDFDNEERYHRKGFWLIANYEGGIVYTAYDPNDPRGLLSDTFLSETFEQAEQIVAEQDKLNAQIGQIPVCKQES